MEAVYRIGRTPVTSSNVAGIGHDPERKVLAIEFHGGDVWHYGGVDEVTFQRFLNSPSPGSFFYHTIKGRFPGQKMTGRCPNCGDHGYIGAACSDCGTADYLDVPRVPKPVL